MEEIQIKRNGFMTIKEFMEFKDISHKTVYNMINDGRLEVKKILGRTLVRLK